MSEALAIGIQPSEFAKMEAQQIDALLLIERLKGKRAGRENGIDSFYQRYGIAR